MCHCIRSVYSDWLRQGLALAETDSLHDAKARKLRHAAERRQHRKPTKLSYKDQRELDQLPAEIDSIEASIVDMQQKIADPRFYSHDHEFVQGLVATSQNSRPTTSISKRWKCLRIN